MNAQRKMDGEGREPVVVFVVEGARYALPLGVVREIRRADEVPEGVPGLAAYRLLGIDEQTGSRRRTLAFADREAHFLLEVDSVEGVTTIQTDALEPIPVYFGGAASELVRGLLAGEEGEMLIVLRAEILRERGMEMRGG